MSSESSDEENLDLLREAADAQFISDSMFNNSKSNKSYEIKPQKLPPSLRKPVDEEDNFNYFKVTPEFRNHVAKQLSNILDNTLKYKTDSGSVTKKKRKSCVKLFNNSDSFVKISKIEEAKVCKPKPIKQEVIVEEEVLKALAVSGEDVLSGKEIKNWSKRCKRKPYEYKKDKSGKLIFVEGSDCKL